MTAPHQRYRAYLESLTPETLADLPDHVTEDVRFRDPFSDVRGVVAMARVFRHMFENVKDIRFEVHHTMLEGEVCLMQWRFQGRLGGRPWTFDGTSAIRFAPDGRVAEHIDYWDAAGNFYERLPVIGRLLSWVRSRLSVR
jgi:predicted ester cyclase